NLVFRGRFPEPRGGEFDTALVRECFWSVADRGGLDLHMEVLYGDNSHHMAEALFKGFARALRRAVERDPREGGVPSTKGVL
ncbi:MAG: imidazoleglycerol-phosphate dehydratase, partial [Nitrospinota bacterium]